MPSDKCKLDRKKRHTQLRTVGWEGTWRVLCLISASQARGTESGDRVPVEKVYTVPLGALLPHPRQQVFGEAGRTANCVILFPLASYPRGGGVAEKLRK